MVRFFALFVACLVAGCAARRPAPPPRDLLAESAVLLRQGCYRCLEDALKLVEPRDDAAARQRAFEVAILLAVRAKEIGLPFDVWRERAATLAAAPTLPASTEFLALTDAFKREPVGLDRNQDFDQRARIGVDEVRGWLTAIGGSPASPEVKAYLELTATCAFVPADRDATLARTRERSASVPLLQYGLGLCTSRELPSLLQAVASVPRFADADYLIGRHASSPLPSPEGQPDAAAALARARQAFPDSPAIAYSEAALYRDRRDWRRALEGFDATLRLVPSHHDARLGRVVALSHLAKHDEAIAGATQLIDEGTWLVGDAYYWRAWNEFHLAQFDDSERDIESAKTRMRWSAVYVLSGLVQWRKERRDAAESELVIGIGMDRDDCDAAAYLGAVRSELRKWPDAADAFAAAEACRDREVVALRKTLDQLVAHNAPATVIEAQRESIAKSEQQAAQMASNRKLMLANASPKPRA